MPKALFTNKEGRALNTKTRKVVAEIAPFIAEYKKAAAAYEQARQRLAEVMTETGDTYAEGEGFTVTAIEAGTSRRLNSRKFKEDLPELYEKYLDTVQTKPYVKITIK